MTITRSFNYAECSRWLLQCPGIIRLLAEIHESNGELRMLARTNGRLLSGLEYSRRFRDAESYCRVSRLDISDTRLKALLYKGVDPKGKFQEMASAYCRILDNIKKFNGDSNPPRLQEKDLLSVDLFPATPAERAGESEKDSVPDLMSVTGRYRRMKNTEPNNKLLITGMIKAFNDAVTDQTVAPLLAILCFVIDYRYIQVALRGFRHDGNLLLMYLLNRYGFTLSHYSSIEKKFEQRAEVGAKAFRESTRHWESGKNDYLPCVLLYLENILAVYRDIFSQLRPVLEEGLSRTQRILRFIGSQNGYVPKRRIVEAHSDVSLRSMEKLLSDLTEEGRIRKSVNGRDVQFRLVVDKPSKNTLPEEAFESDIGLHEKQKNDTNKGFEAKNDPATFTKTDKEKPNPRPDIMKAADPASHSDFDTKGKQNKQPPLT